MKVICPVCEKVVSAYVPKGGDGSALRPYRHGNCEGRFELVEEIYEERLPTMHKADGCQHVNRYTNMASGAVFCRDCGVKI